GRCVRTSIARCPLLCASCLASPLHLRLASSPALAGAGDAPALRGQLREATAWVLLAHAPSPLHTQRQESVGAISPRHAPGPPPLRPPPPPRVTGGGVGSEHRKVVNCVGWWCPPATFCGAHGSRGQLVVGTATRAGGVASRSPSARSNLL